MDILGDKNKKIKKKKKKKIIKFLKEIIKNYSNSKNFGKPFTFTQETYNQFFINNYKKC